MNNLKGNQCSLVKHHRANNSEALFPALSLQGKGQEERTEFKNP
jgi:hypothetical protein